jgi:CheY-like chemotaxis protein
MQEQAALAAGKKPVRILVLEDNPSARFVFRAVLEPMGYDVVEATNETDAVSICGSMDEPLDLLIADVVLRATYGTETSKRIAKMRPGMPILFTSGFPIATLQNRGLMSPDQLPQRKTSFLRKPFTADELREKVRELIGS